MRQDPFRGMGIAARLKGLVRAELRGGRPEAVLNACAQEDIPLISVECADEYTIRLTVRERDWPALEALSRRAQCDADVIAHIGGRRWRRKLLRRRSLLISALLLSTLLFISSLFVWQIDIVGAESLSRGEILRALEESGVGIGTYWPAVSADMLRSRMLLRLPALSWLTIRVRGSRATVVLTERPEPIAADVSGDAELVASRSGIVTRVIVLRGRALVEPGACVDAGEALISGGEERGEAKGTIQAETWYERTALCPAWARGKGDGGKSRTRLALKLGGRRINFYLGSGNPIDGCDKIIHETALGISGLFRLPLSLVREQYVRRPEQETSTDPVAAMEQRLYETLASEIRGEILAADYAVSRRDGLLAVTMRAHCLENIARAAENAGP